MALMVRRGIKREIWAGWPTVSREAMIQSRAAGQLREELRLYLEGAASGRSVLVAGHRGAGKTMAVEATIDAIRRDIFQSIQNKDGEPRRRPVMVRLHGPSLLTGRAPEQAPPRSDGGAEAPDHAAEAEVPKDGTRKSRSAPAVRAKAQKDTLQSALVLITIALYRAVASEFAEAVLIAAEAAAADRVEPRLPPDDLLELPARLRLDLDAGAEPGALRAVLSRIDAARAPSLTGFQHPEPTGFGLTLYRNDRGVQPQARVSRLRTGVLWPLDLQREREGVGFREIVALASISQAFQVCTGKISSSEKRIDTRSMERKFESSVTAGLRDVTQKLFALAAGAAVGVGVASANGTGAGAVSGLAAAVSASMTLTWSSSRSAKGERSLEYTFLPDRSIETLDRDLPQIIDRLRDVGLAPVFVVDEIDKIPEPDEPLRMLMRRLKQLTSDNGFFCFLTDRDYFDRIETRLRESVYPIEHSYYTHRLLVAHRPADVAAFLRAAIVADAPATSAQSPTTPSSPTTTPSPSAVAGLILGRVLMLRSELNTTALVRALSGRTGRDGVIEEDEARLRSLELHRLEAIVQLTIEHVMREGVIADRIAADARFAQISTDVLYSISRAWLDGEESIVISAELIEKRLARRMRGGPVPSNDAILSSGDLGAFRAGLMQMADLLCDFEILRDTLERDGAIAVEDKPLMAVFSPPMAGLLGRGEKPDAYVFRWDPYGRVVPSETQAEDSDVPDRVRRILKLFDDTDVPLDAVVEFGLLPTTVTEAGLQEALKRLDQANAVDPQRPTDLGRLKAFFDAVCAQSAVLQAVFALGHYIFAQVLASRSGGGGSAPLPRDVVSTLRRYLGVGELAGMDGERLRQALDDQLHGSAQILAGLSLSAALAPDSAAWTAEVLRARDAVAEFGGPSPSGSWTFWFRRVRDHLETERSVGQARLADVTAAVLGENPGALFRRDLSDLGIAEWSRVVLEAIGEQGFERWAVLGGLFALGFGRELLEMVDQAAKSMARPADRTETDVDAFAAAVIGRAPKSGQQGLLQIVSRSETMVEPRGPDDPPIVRIHIDDLERYNHALDILQRWSAFAGVTDDGFS